MIVGTAGHIDHGKSTLVRALTGVETDRLKEEKARGISIALGFAYLRTPEGADLGFVDVPGHEKFVHTMLAGATGIDFALLIVAADDGVMPQTREHVAILDLLGVSAGLVALTKSDRADAARRAAVRDEIAALLAPTALAGAPVIEVSAVSGEGVGALRDHLVAAALATAGRSDRGAFRLAVDRSFTLSGAGTVVTGTVLSGRVRVGDRVVVSPSGLPARVRAIHAQNVAAQEGRAGERCALNLAGEGVAKDAIAHGDVVLDPVLHAPSGRIDAELSWLASELRPVGQWLPVRLHHAAAEVAARLVPLDEGIVPGGRGRVQLVLEQPIAAASGDRFVLRDTTAQRTIGGGRFLDLRAPARKRRTPERFAVLEALAKADPAEALRGLLDLPPHAVDFTGFARDRALGAEERAELVQRLDLIEIALGETVTVMTRPALKAFAADLRERLAAFHEEAPDLPGMGVERLRLAAARALPAPVFRALVRGMAREEGLALDGAWLRLESHVIRLSPEEEALWGAIRPLIGGPERFRPPRVRDLAGHLAVPEVAVRRVLKRASRLGQVDEMAQDHFFLRATVAEIVAIMQDIAAGEPRGEFIAAQLRDRLDNGRKVAIQMLEFFDRHGVTFRRGDLRRLNPHRLDLFGALADHRGGRAEDGRESSPVGRPDFKSGRGRETVSGGFDSLSLPPVSPGRKA